MKILFISPFVPPSVDGVGEYTVHLARSLREKGVDARIITRHDQIPQQDWIYPVLRKNQAIAILKCLNEKSWMPDWISLQYVPQLYGKYGLSFSLKHWVSQLRSTLDCKSSITFHEHGTDRKEGFKNKIFGFFLRRQTKFLLDHADHAVTTCKRYQEALLSFKPSFPIKTIPVGAGILPGQGDQGQIENLRLKYDLKNKKVLGIFGRISSFRPFDLVIPILKKLRDGNIPAKLLILGAADASAPQLWEHFLENLKRENLLDSLIAPGKMDAREISLHFNLIDLYIFPQEDGISTRNTTVFSALAHGLKVIAYKPVPGNFSDYPMPPDILLIKQDDPKNFVETAVAQLKLSMSQDDHQKDIQRYFEKYFSWNVLSTEFLKSLETLN